MVETFQGVLGMARTNPFQAHHHPTSSMSPPAVAPPQAAQPSAPPQVVPQPIAKLQATQQALVQIVPGMPDIL